MPSDDEEKLIRLVPRSRETDLLKSPILSEKPELRPFQPPVKPTRDCGAWVIKAGDVVVTRAMFYFIMDYVSKLPEVKKEDLQRSCEELVAMLQEVVK